MRILCHAIILRTLTQAIGTRAARRSLFAVGEDRNAVKGRAARKTGVAVPSGV
jgi:hypothetical protein